MAKGRRLPPADVARSVLVSQMGRCAYCNVSLISRAMQWDHFVPFSYLGYNPSRNWVAACHLCNNAKGNRHLNNEDDLFEFCHEMMIRHGELGEGWPEGSKATWPWLEGILS